MGDNAPSSRLPGFYNLSLEERLQRLSDRLAPEDVAALSGQAGLSAEQADQMIENVIGVFALPLGIALNFVVNGLERLVPMAIEEPSVVAGASFMAKLARAGGGFRAHTTPPEMIGQIQVLELPDLATARHALLENKAQLLAEAAIIDPVLQALGGGPRDLEVREIARVTHRSVPGAAPDLRCARCHGRERRQYCLRAACPTGRKPHRRACSLAHPHQPGRSAPGAGALHHSRFLSFLSAISAPKKCATASSMPGLSLPLIPTAQPRTTRAS